MPMTMSHLGTAAVTAAVAATATFFALQAGAETDKPATQTRIETSAGERVLEDEVRRILVENPDIIVDAITRFEETEMAREEEERAEAVTTHFEELAALSGTYTAGNPDGKVQIVEFFDYNCGFCKSAMPTLIELMEDEPELGVTFVEFPILSQGSEVAARAALAAGRQDRYLDMHRALMGSTGRLDEARVMDIAKELDLDVDRLQADMAAPDIIAAIASHRDLARSMRIEGTPAFIINGQPVTGWREDVVREMIAKAADQG